MTDIVVIPQNIDTCWFNSILTVSLFSQRISPIIYQTLKEFYKKDKSSIISIFKYIYKNKPNDEYCIEFKKILDNQDLIEDIELFGDYSTRDVHSDLSSILKNDKYLKEKSLLKSV